MEEIISSSNMKKVDNYATESLKIPSLILMENAGLGCFYSLRDKPFKTYTIVCSTGNNGGDGLVLARQLIVEKKFVYLNIIGDVEKATDNFKANLEILKKFGLGFKIVKDQASLNVLKSQIMRSDAVVDAIFGIGLSRDIEGIYKDVIDIINQESKYTISLDIPSGLDCDNGFVRGVCVKADKTFTFYKMKNALINESQYAGEVEVIPISIPYDLVVY